MTPAFFGEPDADARLRQILDLLLELSPRQLDQTSGAYWDIEDFVYMFDLTDCSVTQWQTMDPELRWKACVNNITAQIEWHMPAPLGVAS